MAKTKLWMIFTAVAVVAVFGLGYVLVLSPQGAQAASARSKAAQVESTNAGLRSTIARLTEEDKTVPVSQARIATIEARVPTTPALPNYVRWLTHAAAVAHVDLQSIAPGAPSAITVSGSQVVRAPVKGSSAITPTGAPSAALSAAPAVPASALMGIGISYKVVGNYFAVQAFLKQLENGPRATVVSAITLAPGSPLLPSNAKGNLPPNWQTLNVLITATIFTSAVPATAVGTAGAQTPPSAGTASPSVAPATPAGSTAAPKS